MNTFLKVQVTQNFYLRSVEDPSLFDKAANDVNFVVHFERLLSVLI